jgi:hypothetical protein
MEARQVRTVLSESVAVLVSIFVIALLYPLVLGTLSGGSALFHSGTMNGWLSVVVDWSLVLLIIAGGVKVVHSQKLFTTAPHLKRSAVHGLLKGPITTRGNLRAQTTTSMRAHPGIRVNSGAALQSSFP